MNRTGLGYDIHPFAGEGEERPLVLGGVVFPGERGLSGHSDADVAVHALCDALLGAAALGDLGRHFPDSGPEWRGVSSLELLERVVEMLAGEGWRPVNVDLTVIAERPRIAPAVEEMRARLALGLRARPEIVSVKATRPEGLGELGAGAGVACLAIALVERVDPPAGR